MSRFYLILLSVLFLSQSVFGHSLTIDEHARVNQAYAIQAAQMQALMHAAPQSAPKSATTISGATPSLPTTNPRRTYAPSCLSYPLPDTPSGPTYSRVVNLLAYNLTNSAYLLEPVTIIIWRVPCSSSGQFYNSATLMRIQRQPSNEGNLLVAPQFPGILVSQGATGFGDYPFNLLRAAPTSNTVNVFYASGVPINYSTTFVLENFVNPSASLFDFNLGFDLAFDNFTTSNNLFFMSVPTYNPTPQTYPAAFQNIPISGYLSTNWYDPNASGEGIILQIYEVPGDTQNLVVSYSWAAYDPSGVPFWLFGQAEIPRGARVANAQMAYRTGGGLGGNSGSAGAPITWGSATVRFPDCNTMILDYASKTGLPAGIPTGSGTRTWKRLASVNALSCE